jgi:hypothetical protein
VLVRQGSGVKPSLYERRQEKGLGGLGVGQKGGTGGREKALEKQDSGDLIDDGCAIEPPLAIEAGRAAGGSGSMAGQIEEGVGVMGGQALVEEMVREGGVGFFEGLGKGLGFGCLGARGAVGVEGVADEKGFNLVLADEPGDGLEVGAEGSAVECKEGLGGEAERVCDGETDAAIADVQSEGAGVSHGVSVRGKNRG